MVRGNPGETHGHPHVAGGLGQVRPEKIME